MAVSTNGETHLLSGNEALAHGAYEAGVAVGAAAGEDVRTGIGVWVTGGSVASALSIRVAGEILVGERIRAGTDVV